MGLIAGELDVNVPAMDFSALEDFIQLSKNTHVSTDMSREERIYQQRNSRPYPWERRLLENNGVMLHNYNNHPAFAQLVETLDRLPIVKSTRLVLLLSQIAQSDYDFNFHFDRGGPYSFRICLGLDTNKVFLEMSKLKSEFLQMSWKDRILPHHVEDKKYNIIPTKTNTVFCIESKKYPHRVPINNSSMRLVLVVSGELFTPVDELNFISTTSDSQNT